MAHPAAPTSIPTMTAVPYSLAGLAHQHWLRLLAGVLAIGAGVLALLWPSATLQVIGVLFGLNLLVTGLVRAGLLLFLPDYPMLYRLLGIIFGVLTALVGILCLRNVAGSVALLLLVIAIGWLLDGLMEIFLAAGRAEAGTGWHFAAGLVLVLGAVAVLVWPRLGLAAFVGLGGTVLILVGIGQVITALSAARTVSRATQ